MHRPRRFISLLSLALAAVTALAEIPNNYYKPAYKLAKENLKTALHDIINPHQKVSSYNALPSYFQKTDLYPNSNRWWDMYGSEPIYLPWDRKLLNREHSLPKSWWGGGDNTPAYTDLNHLYPGEAAANQKKSNYPLGKVMNSTWTNGVSTIGVGQNSGGAKYVFEPADEYKGDFARTYFYMVTCYQDMNWVTTWQVRNGTYPSLQQWAIDLLLQWHRNDPVSQKEQLRNESVYSIQNNRNPFIDYPELAEYIWGNKMGQQWDPSTSTNPDKEPTITAPINGMALDFGQVALGHSVTRQLLVKGSDLTSNLTLIIAQYNCKYFSIPGTTQNGNGATKYSVAKEAASSTSGTWVTITYTPTETGEHQARGQISGGGLTAGSFAFTLRGECLPVPTLTAPANPAATAVTTESYLATWDAPSDETIDYWVVTRTIYSGSSVTTKEEIAETNELQINDFADSDRESFTVRAVRLGCDSPESNVVFVSRPSGIEGTEADCPLVIESFPGSIRLRCSTPQSGMTVYDMTGRKVVELHQNIENCFELSLSPGVYLVTTPEHPTPLKAIAR